MSVDLLSRAQAPVRARASFLRTPVGGYAMAAAVSVAVWSGLLRALIG